MCSSDCGVRALWSIEYIFPKITLKSTFWIHREGYSLLIAFSLDFSRSKILRFVSLSYFSLGNIDSLGFSALCCRTLLCFQANKQNFSTLQFLSLASRLGNNGSSFCNFLFPSYFDRHIFWRWYFQPELPS